MPDRSLSSQGKPSELTLTLAALPKFPHHNSGWVTADEVRGRLKLLGFHCSTQQVSAWLRRMARTDAPWVEVHDGWWSCLAYRVTFYGKTDLENKLGLRVREQMPWLSNLTLDGPRSTMTASLSS